MKKTGADLHEAYRETSIGGLAGLASSPPSTGGERVRMRSEPRFIPLETFVEHPPEEMKTRACDFHAEIRRRRTVREKPLAEVATFR